MVELFFGQNSSTSGSAFYVVGIRNAHRCPIRPNRVVGITSLFAITVEPNVARRPKSGGTDLSQGSTVRSATLRAARNGDDTQPRWLAWDGDRVG